MGQRFHHAFVEAKGAADQVFAITGHHAARNPGRVRAGCQAGLQRLQALFDRLDGVAPVIGIVLKRHPSLLVDQHDFAGRRAGIDAQEAVLARQFAQVYKIDPVLGAALLPLLALPLVVEQRAQAAFCFHRRAGVLCQPVDDFLQAVLAARWIFQRFPLR